jgi:hypothetical protein
MKGQKTAKGKGEALLADEVIVSRVGKVAAGRGLARGAVRCTPYQIR